MNIKYNGNGNIGISIGILIRLCPFFLFFNNFSMNFCKMHKFLLLIIYFSIVNMIDQLKKIIVVKNLRNKLRECQLQNNEASVTTLNI